MRDLDLVIDLRDHSSPAPHPTRHRLAVLAPGLATMGLVGLVGGGAHLVMYYRDAPPPPPSAAAVAAGAVRLTGPGDGVPPRHYNATIDGQDITVALIDVAQCPYAPVAIVSVVVDGRAGIHRLMPGIPRTVHGVRLELIDAYPRVHRHDESADIRIG